MKKVMKKIFTIAATVITLISCENYDFGNTGIDPNKPLKANPSSLLLAAQSKIVGTISLNTTTTPSLYVQHLSQTQFSMESRYQTINFDWFLVGSGLNNVDYSVNFYSQIIRNLYEVIKMNTDETTKTNAANFGSNNNQIAVAQVLIAYYYIWATDRWGMLPYTEALQGLANPKAKYDSQETIYKEMFLLIDQGIANMTLGNGPVGDMMFNGDMNKWWDFAHTLKMNMAIRLAKVYPAADGYAATKFKEALVYTILNVGENILFPSISDEAYDNPYQDLFVDNLFRNLCMSDVLVNRMLELKDPRLPKYANPAVATGKFVGWKYGVSDVADISQISLMNYNLIANATAPIPMFTYAQVAFNKAEAALLGWIPGSVQSFYEEGIKASMEQWGVFDTEANTYLLEADVAFDKANAMNQIAEQKWLALFYQPYEAWAEWRRLDYPVLTPAVEALNGNSIPVRHGYPIAEANLNKANYEAAIAAQGPDDLFTKLWWDVD